MTDTYRAIHTTLLQIRGPASDHTCSCGKPAVDWAYQFTAGDRELRCEGGRGPHSINPDDYAAMCRSCHVLFDREHDPQCTEARLLELTTRWRTNPEYREKIRSAQRKAAHRRRRCLECGFVSNPGGMGTHRTKTGHDNWIDEAPEEDE